jgi:hypothetical protein
MVIDKIIDRLNEEFAEKMIKIQKDYSKLPDWLKCGKIKFKSKR